MEVIAARVLPVPAAALVNPLVRVPGAVSANERIYHVRCEWTDAGFSRRFSGLRP
jgi:hypothetical protein